jgi:integrase
VSNIKGMSYEIPSPVKIGFDGRVIASASKDRVKYWRVTVSATKTEDGKKIRRFFDTEKNAKGWIEKTEGEIAQRGKKAFDLSEPRREEALRCITRLAPFHATLTQAVDYFLKHSRPDGGKKKFREVGAEFMSSRINADCKPRTLGNYRSFLNVANDRWGDELVSEIHLREIEAWVADGEWEPRTRRNYLASMSAVLGFAHDRKYCAENAAKKATRPRLQDKEIEILTPAEAIILLEGCQLFAPDLTAAMAIGLFAGLRTSEICSLDWKEIDLETRCIEITAAKAKTRQRRIVHISDNLLAWLKAIEPKTGPVLSMGDGSSIHISSGLFGYRRAQLLTAIANHRQEKNLPVVFAEWPGNGLRHSFGSYYFAQSKNENLTAAEMGNSPARVYKHYREVVKPAAVAQYWSIIPSACARNIIPITRAA